LMLGGAVSIRPIVAVGREASGGALILEYTSESFATWCLAMTGWLTPFRYEG